MKTTTKGIEMTKIIDAIADAILVAAKVRYLARSRIWRAMNRTLAATRMKLNAKLHKIKKIFRRW